MLNRNKTYKIQALVFTLGFVLILLFVNLIATEAGNKFNFAADLTSNSRFTLSKQSEDILSKLDKNITIYLAESEKKPMDSRVTEILNRYSNAANGKITIIRLLQSTVNRIYHTVRLYLNAAKTLRLNIRAIFFQKMMSFILLKTLLRTILFMFQAMQTLLSIILSGITRMIWERLQPL